MSEFKIKPDSRLPVEECEEENEVMAAFLPSLKMMDEAFEQGRLHGVEQSQADVTRAYWAGVTDGRRQRYKWGKWLAWGVSGAVVGFVVGRLF